MDLIIVITFSQSSLFAKRFYISNDMILNRGLNETLNTRAANHRGF